VIEMLKLTGRIVKALKSIAAKEKTRYALTDIDVRPTEHTENEAGESILEASDGRRLLRYYVEGNSVEAGHRIPAEVADRVKVKDEVLVFPEKVSVGKGDVWSESKLATTDQGRMPRFDDVFPTEKPAITVAMNPKLLGELLLAVAQLQKDVENPFVFLDVFPPNDRGEVTKVVMVRGRDKDGQRIRALQMPVMGDEDPDAAERAEKGQVL
jgi:hypothetical protein